MTGRGTTIPAGLAVADTCVDVLVVGSGTGMAAALAAHELGLSVLIVEKSSQVGGSTARSGGALWLPGSAVLRGANDTAECAVTYLDAVVAGSAPAPRSAAFVGQVSAMVDMLCRTTPLRLFWARDYSDTTPKNPVAARRAAPANAARWTRRSSAHIAPGLRPGVLEPAISIPTTGADYRWMNLVARVPRKGIPTFAKRIAQGLGGWLLSRRYAAGGQALMAGLFAGVLRGRYPGVDRHQAAALRQRRRASDRGVRGP